MRRFPAFGRIFAVTLALVLAAMKCPAEGPVFSETADTLAAPPSTPTIDYRAGSSLYDSGLTDTGSIPADTVSAVSTSGGTVSPPPAASPLGNATVVFPVIGLAALLIVSLQMRRNNVFRQNMMRVFLHPHGFHMDLRYRRFLHTAQPFLLILLEAVSVALVAASILHRLLDNPTLERYVVVFPPNSAARLQLLDLAADPLRAVLIIGAVVVGLIAVLTVLLRLVSIPFRERMDMWQAMNYVIWSFAAILLLLPIGMILFRLLDTPKFINPALIFVGLVLVWTLQRLLSAVRIGLGTSTWKVYLGAIVLAGILILGGAAVLRYEFGAPALLDHFSRPMGVR